MLIICKKCTKIMKTEIYKVTKKNEYHRTMWCGTVDAKSEVSTVNNGLVAQKDSLWYELLLDFHM